jgi:hypothetical protein
MATVFSNSQASNGTTTVTAAAGPGVVWNLCSLTVSQAGPTSGTNAKLTIYDGAVGGTVLFAAFLNGPGAAGTGIGSVGTIQEIPLPFTPDGKARSIQASPGNAMNIQVTGTGANQVSVNARFSDGLPT